MMPAQPQPGPPTPAPTLTRASESGVTAPRDAPPDGPDQSSSNQPAPTRRPARRSGPVVPHRLGWGRQALAAAVYGLIRLTAVTLRRRMEIDPAFHEAARGPVIFTVWHNRLPLCLIVYRLLLPIRHRPHRLAALVSASRDGAVVARILELFGVQPVRGSTSRRGPQALLELTTWGQRGYDLALTPDGPRGPCYVAQPGPILLARLTGLPVIPVSYQLSWRIRLNTWDRFQIPLPGGRWAIRVGAPVWVPRDASEQVMEALRQQLQQRLRSLTAD